MSGYLKYQRDRFDHPLFKATKRNPFCKGYAWDWMCAQARFKDRPAEVVGKIVELKRGQFSHSIRYMADAWGWDKSSVLRYMKRLKTETMIETQTETGQLIITICNYEKFQSASDDSETGNEPPNETGARQERDRSETNKKERKKDNKGKKDSPHTPQGDFVLGPSEPVPDFENEFQTIWKHYPRKVGTDAAFGAWVKARKKASFEEISKPLGHFIRAINGTEKSKIPHLTTWLNQGRWKDEQSDAVNRNRTTDDELDALMGPKSTDDELDQLFPSGFPQIEGPTQ